MTRHAAVRGVTALEAAIGFAVLGSLLVIAIVAFRKEWRASRFVEPVEGLARLGESSLRFAHGRPKENAFPPTIAQTPAVIPKGAPTVDPEGTWAPWRPLEFSPVADGIPHSFAFSYESGPSAGGSIFSAKAHADLDGDSVLSTFEIRGKADASGAIVEPGMFVEKEFE